MTNQANNDYDYEEAKRVRRNVVTTVLIVLLLIAIAYAYHQYQNRLEAQNLLDKRIAYNKEIKKHNDKVDAFNKQLEKDVGVYETKQATNEFYNYFFDWDSWSQYRDNMAELRKMYPNIDKGKVVNISGDKIGAGVSPTSTHSTTSFIGDKEGRVVDFVEQSKSYQDGTETKAIWYVISDYKDGKLDIKEMKPYRSVSE
ncbi:hypothetical protein [Staphylococcus warneri]|uniref:hypothetical protein n=1 Tax=Staphylococcus warneri TaxID=1292 RepID=UPI003B9DF717